MNDPHRDQPVRTAGAPLAQAEAAVVLLHGRGASAEDILGLAGEMYDERIAYLAPQAADHRWYPYSFMAPIAENEPWLSSALAKVGAVVQARRRWRHIAGAHISLWLLPGRLPVYGIYRPASCAIWRTWWLSPAAHRAG